MKNQRFRLSYMTPNAWFYKLRDMNTTAAAASATTKDLPTAYSSTSKQHHHHPRNSIYYTPRLHQIHISPAPTSRKSLTKKNTTHKPASPKHALSSSYTQLTESTHIDQDLFLSPATDTTPKSRKTLTKKNTTYKPASPKHALSSSYVRLTESTHTDQDLFLSPTKETTNYESPSPESTQSCYRLPTTSCSCRVISSSTSDIIIDFNEKPYTKKIQDSSGFDLIPDIDLQKLPPIITKSKNNTSNLVEKKEETGSQSTVSIKIVEEDISKKETPERTPVSGVKMGSISPKTAVSKRIIQGNDHKSFKSQKNNKRNFSENCAIVKSSFDPQEDFKESMVEMIEENNIWESKELEELLVCYLSLNSDEYHDTIVKAFEQIWLTFDFVV